ncbi:MAG TPA: type IV secretion protein IcmC [Legionellaceae bacterium]|nr:type IV secretion protein IcmC [Legionellaceae bacterium]
MAESWYSGSENVLTNLANSLLPVEKMLTGGAYLMGLAFAIKAILTLKTHGEQRSSMSGTGNMKEAGVYLFVAAMLVYYPTAFKIFMNSTFGYENVLAYAPMNTSTPLISNLFGNDNMVGYSLTVIVQVIGLVAFIRGWVMIARGSAQGQAGGTTGKGLMHVFGGILAMNIIGTLEVFHNTLFGVS